jgi:hypothetical protein
MEGFITSLGELYFRAEGMLGAFLRELFFNGLKDEIQS